MAWRFGEADQELRVDTHRVDTHRVDTHIAPSALRICVWMDARVE